MYNDRTTKVRIEHEIRLVLRGDLTVDDASDRIMIIARLWRQNDQQQNNAIVPSLRNRGEGDKSDS